MVALRAKCPCPSHECSGSSFRVAQHFHFPLSCETFTRMNSSPSSRPSGSPDDDEHAGKFLVVVGPGDFMASALGAFDIFVLKRQDLQVN